MDAIALERCFNHPNREAVARCPECRRTFCRECVTEHDDRVICASCLRKLTSDRDSGKRRRRAVSVLVQFLIGFMIVWLLFYYLGQMLLLIPSSFHEGNLWHKDLVESL